MPHINKARDILIMNPFNDTTNQKTYNLLINQGFGIKFAQEFTQHLQYRSNQNKREELAAKQICSLSINSYAWAIRKQIPIGTRTSLELAGIIQELLSMATNCPTTGCDREVFLGDKLLRTRELGQRLFEIGGKELMLFVANKIPTADQREIDYAWNNIGGWLA